MWYNTQLKAKPPRIYSASYKNKYNPSISRSQVNPRGKNINIQKLRDLLIDRFVQNII